MAVKKKTTRAGARKEKAPARAAKARKAVKARKPVKKAKKAAARRAQAKAPAKKRARVAAPRKAKVRTAPRRAPAAPPPDLARELRRERRARLKLERQLTALVQELGQVRLFEARAAALEQELAALRSNGAAHPAAAASETPVPPGS